MTRTEAREFAIRLFLREHDRWTQNALVLFGALVFIFTIHGQLKPAFSLGLALRRGHGFRCHHYYRPLHTGEH